MTFENICEVGCACEDIRTRFLLYPPTQTDVEDLIEEVKYLSSLDQEDFDYFTRVIRETLPTLITIIDYYDELTSNKQTD